MPDDTPQQPSSVTLNISREALISIIRNQQELFVEKSGSLLEEHLLSDPARAALAMGLMRLSNEIWEDFFLKIFDISKEERDEHLKHF